MTLIDEQVPFEPRRGQRRHEQHERTLLVIPPIAETLTGDPVISIPTRKISGTEFFHGGVVSDLDPRERQSPRNPDAVQLSCLLQEGRGVVFRGVDHVPATGVPSSRIAPGGSRTVEQRMAG